MPARDRLSVNETLTLKIRKNNNTVARTLFLGSREIGAQGVKVLLTPPGFVHLSFCVTVESWPGVLTHHGGSYSWSPSASIPPGDKAKVRAVTVFEVLIPTPH